MEPDDPRVTLEQIDALLRKYAQQRENAIGDGDNILVTSAVVMYEVMTYDTDGDALYTIQYAFPSPTSMSSAYGVASLGLGKIEQDMLGDGCACEDDDGEPS